MSVRLLNPTPPSVPSFSPADRAAQDAFDDFVVQQAACARCPSLERRIALYCAWRRFLALYLPATTPAATADRHAALARFARALALEAEDLRCVTP